LMNHAVEVTGLTKSYGSTVALAGISFHVEPGKLVCLAGPNGAGKTTTVRIVATQLKPGGGQVRVLGWDVRAEARKIRRRLATVPQEARPDGDLTAWEHVYYYLRARGVSRVDATERSRNTLERFGLWSRRNSLCRQLSGGLRRRVMLAMAVSTHAEVLLLDEPTIGLDPVARRETWDLLAEVKSESTIILTSHSMEEVDVLSDRIVVIVGGRIVADGTPAQLRQRLPSRERIVLLETDDLDWDRLHALGTVRTIAGRPVVYPSSHEAAREIVSYVHGRSLAFSVEQTSLEDAYVAIMEQSALSGGEVS